VYNLDLDDTTTKHVKISPIPSYIKNIHEHELIISTLESLSNQSNFMSCMTCNSHFCVACGKLVTDLELAISHVEENCIEKKLSNY
jgi:hypothetical protein